MKHLKKFFLLITISLLTSVTINAQSVDLVATVDITPPLIIGQTFNYSIMSTGNPYNALRIKLNYDSNIIQLNSLTPVYNFDFTPVNDTSTPGLIRFEAASLSGNITTDEVIFTIEFEVLDNTQAISIAHNYDAADGTVVINNSGNDILGTANDILLETLSLTTFNLDDTISIYPNPAQDIVTVKLANNDIIIQSITIQTLEGKTILLKDFGSNSVEVNSFSLDISTLSDDLYFLTIETKKGNRNVTKLLVSH